jgi:hypothetical protein
LKKAPLLLVAGLLFIRNVTGGDMVPGGALRLFFQKMSTDADGTLLFNLVNIRQKQVIYGEFGLDWKWIRDAVRETFNDDVRWSELKEGTNVFRILVRTLLGAEIITDRTRHVPAGWVDMMELNSERHEIPGEAVVADGA